MTRAQSIKQQTDLFGPASDLTAICMCLRSGVNGSSNEWEAGFVRVTIDMLRARLQTWEPGRQQEARMDNAVKELVAATIAEVESYDWWK